MSVDTTALGSCRGESERVNLDSSLGACVSYVTDCDTDLYVIGAARPLHTVLGQVRRGGNDFGQGGKI